jgi:septal ring factor EnvC (AmiA/AmiB activator)
VEHGRTLQVLQERYAELANALFLAVSSLTQHHAALLASSQATAAALAASRYNERGLQEQLSSVQTALQESQEANAILTSQHEQLQQDSQQTAQQLQQLVVSLKQQLWQARCDWEQQAAAAEAAAQTEGETASSRVQQPKRKRQDCGSGWVLWRHKCRHSSE